jgi:hypothetical protein
LRPVDCAFFRSFSPITIYRATPSSRCSRHTVEVLEAGVTSFDEGAHRDALRELEKTLGAKILR